MPTLAEDVQANHPFLLSSYGETTALGFRGSTEFIERCFNWVCNTGIVGPSSRLNWLYERGGVAYICAKSKRAIFRGLVLQLTAEIALAKEVPYKADHSRDDDWEGDPDKRIELDHYRIAKLAVKRAKLFWEQHVMKDSFMLDRPQSTTHIYTRGAPGRAESAFE